MTNLLTSGVLSVQLLLPAFNHFAERAGLEVELPLDEKRITKSHIGKASPSAMVTFDGRHQFNWHSIEKDARSGRIYYLDTQFNGSSGAAVFRQVTNQQSKITINEARQIANGCLKNLGYDLTKINAGEPRVGQFTYKETPADEPMPIPLFGFRWFPSDITKPEWHDRLIEIQVSGITKKIVYFSASPASDKSVAVDLSQFSTNRAVKPVPLKRSLPGK